MDVASRRLVVVRHAKSAWPAGVPDRERPLGPRGQADAPRMAERIQALVGDPDVAVISPSRRTRETWALMGQRLAPGQPVRTDDRIYQAWGAHLLDVVRDMPEDAGTALVLGHEPGVSELVLDLADGRDAHLIARITAKFPTCAVAVLVAQVPWADFGPGCARLEHFATPRD